MNRFQRSITLFLATLALTAFSVGCDDDTTDPGDAPKASFTVSGDLSEGSTITLTNTSTNATSYSWSSVGLPVSSTGKDLTVALDTEGTYTIKLIAIGSGGTDTASQTITVARNNWWRATGAGTKTWYISKFQAGPIDLANDPCYWDNTLEFKAADSTFFYKEGATACEFAPLPPQSGTFAFNNDFSVMTFHTTDPMVMSTEYPIASLGKDTVVAVGTINGVTATITLTTTQRN